MVLEQFIIDADIIWDQVGKTFFENPEAKPGRIMRVQVVNAGIIEDLTGYTLNLGWTSVRDPSKFGLDAFDDVDITKGIFEIEYTSGMLTNIGPLNASLQLVPPGEGRPIESNNFKLTVKNSAINPAAIQAETSFSTLENALVEVNGWNARIDVVEQEFKDRADALDGAYPVRLTAAEQSVAAVEAQVDLLNRGLGETMVSLALLNSTYPTGDTRDHIVAGNIAEVDTLTVTAIPTVAGNITVTLNSVAKTIAVDPAVQTTTALLATLIRGTAFTGWTTGGTGTVVTFTSTTTGARTVPTFSGGTTGVTASIVVTVKGENANFHRYFWNGTAWADGGAYQAVESNSEIKDGRLGVDGTLYSDLGGAIRGQVNYLAGTRGFPYPFTKDSTLKRTIDDAVIYSELLNGVIDLKVYADDEVDYYVSQLYSFGNNSEHMLYISGSDGKTSGFYTGTYPTVNDRGIESFQILSTQTGKLLAKAVVDWSKINTNKGIYLTLATTRIQEACILRGMTAVSSKGILGNAGITDLNVVHQNSIYSVRDTTGVSNLPEATVGIFTTFADKEQQRLSQLYQCSNGNLYYRSLWTSASTGVETWTAWRKGLVTADVAALVNASASDTLTTVRSIKNFPYPFSMDSTLKRPVDSLAIYTEALGGIIDLKVYANDDKDYYVSALYSYSTTFKSVIEIRNEGSSVVGSYSVQRASINELGIETCEIKTTGGILVAKVVIDWTKINTDKGINLTLASTRIQEACIVRRSTIPFPKILVYPKQYATIGRELNFYYHQIFACTDWKAENITPLFSYNGTGSDSFDDRISIIPTVAGTFSLDIWAVRVVDGVLTSSSKKTISVKVCADSVVSGTKKVIFLGDSRTDNAKIETYAKDQLGTSIELLGSRETNGYKHEGRSGWTAGDYCNLADRTGVPNAFWNPTTSAFDFSYYMSQQGYTGVDYVNLLFGVNGTYSASGVNDIDTLVTSIHTYNPAIKVTIMIEYVLPFSSYYASSYNRSYLGQLHYDYLLNKFDGREAENILIVPTNTAIDDNFDWGKTTVSASMLNPTLMSVISDNIHPNTYGYSKLSNTWLMFFKNKELV